MKYKRLLALLLAVILALPALFAPATAHAAGEMSYEDMQKAMKQIAEAAGRITELSGGAAVSSVFDDFLNVVITGGSVVTAINGTVTFLRLIGLIEDPVTGGIANIIGQLQNVDEKMDSMDSQLKSIADKMTQMQAEQDLYHRGETALMMSAAWKSSSLTTWKSWNDLAKARKRCVTGIGNYCYLTSSEVIYTSAFL